MGFIASLIRWVGVGAAAIMLLSFLLFAFDTSGHATTEQVKKAQGRENEPVSQVPAKKSEARQKIDDANAKLSRPFEFATKNINSEWFQRGLTALLGVIVFGLGFAWLANLVPKPKMREPTPWHT